MRILVAGDLHGSITHSRWVVQRAADLGADHVLQVGDFGFWTHERRGTVFLDSLSHVLNGAKMSMVVVRGNHDNTAKILQDYGHDRTDEGFVRVRPRLFLAPDGLTWRRDGKTFISLGGAYSPDRDSRLEEERKTGRLGSLWFPGEQMSAEEFHLAVAGKEVDVIVAHDRPASAALPPGLPFMVSNDPRMIPNPERLAQAIQVLRPSLYLHGHLHVRYEDKVRHNDGWTRVVGISSDPGTSMTQDPVHSVMLLDTDDMA